MYTTDIGPTMALALHTIVKNRNRLTEASNEILKCSQYFVDIDVKRIKKELKSFDRDEQDFKDALSELVEAVQTGRTSEDALTELLDELEESSCSTSMVDVVIDSYQALLRRISFIRHCEEVNIKVISSTGEISNLLSPSASGNTYFLIIPKAIDYTTVEQ
ncbi:hypothetical protein BGZ74_004302, partial [Mortierella antarctica]